MVACSTLVPGRWSLCKVLSSQNSHTGPQTDTEAAKELDSVLMTLPPAPKDISKTHYLSDATVTLLLHLEVYLETLGIEAKDP